MNRNTAQMFWIALATTLSPMAVMAHTQDVERKLVEAATSGSLAEIRQLVTKDVDLSNSYALSAAVSGRHLDVVKFLVEKGADPSRLLLSTGFRLPPMFVAAKEGHPEVLEYVVAHGANLNYESPTDTSGISTPLISAVYYGNFDAARLLVSYGADVNYVSKYGNTALMQAITYTGGDGTNDKSAEFIKLFLSKGANPDIPDRNGITARQYAKSNQRPELSVLIENAKPTPPNAVQASASDLQTIAMVLQAKETCDQAMPGFRGESASAYQTWRTRNAPLIAQIEKSPAFKERIAHLKEEYAKKSSQPTPQALAQSDARQMEEYCEDGVLGQLTAYKKSGPDPKLASPELTWAHYLESLRNGDRDAAISCLASTARSKFRKLIMNVTDEQLRSMGESIKSFELTGVKFGEFVEGVASRKDGRAGIVTFENINGEWMISEM